MSGRKPVQRREHGTKACYLRGPGPGTGQGCRCPACRKANTAFNVKRERGLIRGDWAPWTDAAPVRAHVIELMCSGMTQENVGALAGVAPGSMTHLMRGSRGGEPGRRIRPETARKILVVQPLADLRLASGFVNSTGTVRRIRALIAIGWPAGWLADRLPMQRANFSVMMRGTQVRASTAAAIREMYGRLWNQQPPQDTPYKAKAVRAALALAAREGWVPPMAWDDDSIDNPSAGAADWKRSSSTQWRAADLAGEAEELARLGYTRDQAAERIGVSRTALDKAVERTRRAA